MASTAANDRSTAATDYLIAAITEDANRALAFSVQDCRDMFGDDETRFTRADDSAVYGSGC